MNVLRRYTLPIHITVTIILLAWMLFVRQVITGKAGWELFLVALLFAPVTVVFALVSGMLIKSRLEVLKAKLTGWLDVVMLWVVYAAVFVCVFYMPYAGDGDYAYTKPYNRSVAMMVFGITKDQTYEVHNFLVVAAPILMLTVITVLAYERIKRRTI